MILFSIEFFYLVYILGETGVKFCSKFHHFHEKSGLNGLKTYNMPSQVEAKL